jgi:hypothetical protein
LSQPQFVSHCRERLDCELQILARVSGGVADSCSLPGNADFKTKFGIGGVGSDPTITMRLVRPAGASGTPTVVTESNFHEFTD